MIKRGLSVFDPPKELIDASGVTPKLNEGERVLWIGTPGWISTLYCTTNPTTLAGFVAVFVACRGFYVRTAEQYAIEGLLERRALVIAFLVLFAVSFQLISLRLGSAFVYILTTKKMIVKIDRTKFLVRLFHLFQKVADAEGFAAYDLRYLNGCRVYSGLWGYGNVSFRSTIGSLGEHASLSEYGSKPAFFRDRRYVKVLYRKIVMFHLAETLSNTLFGIKDVARLGYLLNDQCAASFEAAGRIEPNAPAQRAAQ